jgi:lactate racemase
VIEPGGELLIYAPHLRCLSDTHGDLIRRYGYAPLEKIKQLVAHSSELQQNLCVAAHLAHVSFAGRVDEKGESVFRYAITLASKVSQSECLQVNLGYMNPTHFNRADYLSDPDTLIVEHAGRDLYLVEPLSN